MLSKINENGWARVRATFLLHELYGYIIPYTAKYLRQLHGEIVKNVAIIYKTHRTATIVAEVKGLSDKTSADCRRKYK